ncbi:MAG: type II toxin-antitoxin system VapB family antitoxin [Bryobacterales bacterium]|nr:type II toxin-antitoxin system VapB family antitoxin [Bryobacterales bacterium]
MPISIKNDETEKLTRQLAELTGETITVAIRIAVAERYDRVKRSKGGPSLRDELKEIALRCARLPVISDMTDDEILGYYEFGIPTR